MSTHTVYYFVAYAVLAGTIPTTPWHRADAQRAPAQPVAHAARVPVITLTPSSASSEALHVLLAREADSAARHGQLALVDLGRKDCEVCHVFHHTFTDRVMIEALKGARLIELDGDDWSSQAITDGFQFDGDLPLLFVVTPEGWEGAVFNHSGWADAKAKLGSKATDAQVMGPPLQAFLAHVRDSTAQNRRHTHLNDSTAHTDQSKPQS